MSALLIRAATSLDAETITRFNLAMATETEHRALDEHTVRSGVRRLLADPTRGVYYVGERDGNIVGQMMITYEWSDWRDGIFWWIQSVYVRPEARGAGVYRALHEWVAQLARRNERVCGLRLYVEGRNTAAQQVYERMGMSRTSYQLFEVDWASPAAGDLATRLPATDPGRLPQSQPGGQVHTDLYCLKCGYNLRGLSGDPCRCPECGNENPRGDIELPAALISRQLREMESGPAYCVGALLALTLIIVAMLALPPNWSGNLSGFTLIAIGVSVVGWCVCARMFYQSCLGKPGWLGTLFRYHAAGLLSLAVVVAIPVLSAWGLRQAVGRVFDASAMLMYTTLMIAVAAGVAAALYAGVRPLHQFAKGKMEELQREVAVEIARTTLRKRLAERRIWS